MNAPLVTDPIARSPLCKETVALVRAEWILTSTHICTQCADHPRTNPSGTNEWVCVTCGFTTHNPHKYFAAPFVTAA